MKKSLKIISSAIAFTLLCIAIFYFLAKGLELLAILCLFLSMGELSIFVFPYLETE